MRGYVIDASVVVEYLLKTELGNVMSEFLERSSLAAPEIMDIEVLSAFRRAFFKGELSHTEALRAIDALSTWNVRRVSHRELLQATWRYFQNVSSYDSVYLATAKRLKLEVITADSKLTRAPGVDVTVHDVRVSNVLAQLETR